ncbi:MAG TPA: hypothetical protein VG840_07480, partial [Casimicrobiaceae bacterium]|nr:hypothetical protein [Casimicrobiaceae bacterium]
MKTPSRYNVDPDGATQVVYTIAYANASAVAVTNATISDALPAGASYVGCGGAGCSESAGTVTWPIGTLNAGASGAVTVTITVTSGFAGSSLTNVASLFAADAGGNALAQTAQATIAVNQPTPSVPVITLAKAATATQVAPGATATWTIDYTNAGTGTANGVTIVDPLPAGFTFLSCGGGVSCSNSAGTMTWNVGSVPAGGSGTVSVSATAANPFTSPNPAANTVSANWTENAGAPVSASAQIGVTGQACSNYYFRGTTASVGFDGVRNLATTVVPTNATASSVTFNATTSPAEAARFYQDPPAASSVAFSGNITTSFYVTKSSGPQLKMDVLVYDYDPVTGTKTSLGTQSFTQTGGGTPNQLFTFTLPLSGALTKGHRILWVFNAYSNNNTTFTFNFDGTASPSGASFCVTPPPNLTLAKSVDKATATAGSATPVQYTLRFANTGQAKATGSQIVDTLPSGVTFGSATLNGAAIVPLQSGQQLSFANVNSSTDAVAGEVAPGASGTLVIAATIDTAASGPLTNQASIASNETTPVASSATTTLSSGAGGGGGTPSLAISLAADRASAAPGDVVTYTVTVVNVGSANAADVQVSDALPIATYYAFGGCSGGCVNGGGTLSWNAGTLAPGASASYTFTMQAGSV